MRREENWAIAPERIQHFFCQQPDVTQTPDGFGYASCKISLIPCSEQLMGKWQQARTIVIMEGSEKDVSQIYQRFFLQFLSAGG